LGTTAVFNTQTDLTNHIFRAVESSGRDEWVIAAAITQLPIYIIIAQPLVATAEPFRQCIGITAV
jgi:hypothetical protein